MTPPGIPPRLALACSCKVDWRVPLDCSNGLQAESGVGTTSLHRSNSMGNRFVVILAAVINENAPFLLLIVMATTSCPHSSITVASTAQTKKIF